MEESGNSFEFPPETLTTIWNSNLITLYCWEAREESLIASYPIAVTRCTKTKREKNSVRYAVGDPLQPSLPAYRDAHNLNSIIRKCRSLSTVGADCSQRRGNWVHFGKWDVPILSLPNSLVGVESIGVNSRATSRGKRACARESIHSRKGEGEFWEMREKRCNYSTWCYSKKERKNITEQFLTRERERETVEEGFDEHFGRNVNVNIWILLADSKGNGREKSVAATLAILPYTPPAFYGRIQRFCISNTSSPVCV